MPKSLNDKDACFSVSLEALHSTVLFKPLQISKFDASVKMQFIDACWSMKIITIKKKN